MDIITYSFLNKNEQIVLFWTKFNKLLGVSGLLKNVFSTINLEIKINKRKINKEIYLAFDREEGIEKSGESISRNW